MIRSCRTFSGADFFLSGQHWIRAAALYLPVKEGGQGLIDMSLKGIGLQAPSCTKVPIPLWTELTGYNSTAAEDGWSAQL